jgi:hypothetical protein
MAPNPRNGSFWVFYGFLAASVILAIGMIVYAAIFIRPSDVRTIAETKTIAVDTKKSFDQLVVGRTPEGFHRKDMREWCEEFERTNRGSGIICPDPYGLRGFREPR